MMVENTFLSIDEIVLVLGRRLGVTDNPDNPNILITLITLTTLITLIT